MNNQIYGVWGTVGSNGYSKCLHRVRFRIVLGDRDYYTCLTRQNKYAICFGLQHFLLFSCFVFSAVRLGPPEDFLDTRSGRDFLGVFVPTFGSGRDFPGVFAFTLLEASLKCQTISGGTSAAPRTIRSSSYIQTMCVYIKPIYTYICTYIYYV